MIHVMVKVGPKFPLTELCFSALPLRVKFPSRFKYTRSGTCRKFNVKSLEKYLYFISFFHTYIHLDAIVFEVLHRHHRNEGISQLLLSVNNELQRIKFNLSNLEFPYFFTVLCSSFYDSEANSAIHQHKKGVRCQTRLHIDLR